MGKTLGSIRSSFLLEQEIDKVWNSTITIILIFRNHSRYNELTETLGHGKNELPPLWVDI